MSTSHSGPPRRMSSSTEGHAGSSTAKYPLPPKPVGSSTTSSVVQSSKDTLAAKRRSISPVKLAVKDRWSNPLDKGRSPPPILASSSSKGPGGSSSKSKEIFMPKHEDYEPIRRPKSPRRYDHGGSRYDTYPRSPPPLRYESTSSRRERESEKLEGYRDHKHDRGNGHERDDSRRSDHHDGRRRIEEVDRYGSTHRRNENYDSRDVTGNNRYDGSDYDRRYDHGRSHTSSSRYEPGQTYRSDDKDRRSRNDYDEPRRRSRSRSRSPLRKRDRESRHSSPARPATPPMEEGEIDDDEIRPRTPSTSPPPLPPVETPNGENHLNGNGHAVKPRKLHMNHRPPPPIVNYSSRTPPPPPPDSPPPPPDEVPPPPSDSPFPPATSPSKSKISAIPTGPSKYDGHHPHHIPHAPNRNLLNPTTRASTPVIKADVKVSVRIVPKNFRRPTEEEERNKYNKNFVGTSTLAAYDLGTKLGEGTFGVVTKAVEHATKRTVALKKLLTHNPRDGVSVTTVREIKILKSLNHPNVVPILDMVVQPKSNSEKSGRQEVFMVFPFMDHDLCGLLGNPQFKIRQSIAKLFMKQILEGMAYIHANNFVHRDIKTANILVDQRGAIMIADFGLARTWTNDPDMPKHMANEYTNMVVTRWYRAPELLLGDTHYGPAVDMWSLGCVLGEMYHRDPILPGGPNDDDQMRRIVAHCGPLNNETFPGWDVLPGFAGMEGFRWERTPAEISIKESANKWGMDEAGSDLLIKLLTLDPAKRITAEQALDHPWFWISPKPAKIEKTDLGVESSHEMTTRKKEIAAPPPVPQQSYHHHQNQYNQIQRQGSGGFRPNRGGAPAWASGGGGRGGYANGPIQGHSAMGGGGMNMGGRGGYAGNMGPGPNLGMGGPPLMNVNMGGQPGIGMHPGMAGGMNGLPQPNMAYGNGFQPHFNGPTANNYGNPPGPNYPQRPPPAQPMSNRHAPPPPFALAGRAAATGGVLPPRPGVPTGPANPGNGGMNKHFPPGRHGAGWEDNRRRAEEGEIQELPY